MSLMETITVTGVLKNFLGPLLLPLGGAVTGLVVALLLSTTSPNCRIGSLNDGLLPVRASVPLGFLLGAGASVYFFGWMSLGVPAIVAALLGLKVFINAKRRKRQTGGR